MKISKSGINAERLQAVLLYNHVHGVMNLNIFRPAYCQAHLTALSRLRKFYIWLNVVKDIKNKTASFSLDCVMWNILDFDQGL